MEVEQYDFSYRTHMRNLEIDKRSRRATSIALISQKAAEETSRTTRANVQLLMLTTPCAISLQYFCGESNFLSIERTAKSFLICFAVLLVLFYFASIGIDLLNSAKDALIRKILEKMGRKKRLDNASDGIDPESENEIIRGV